MEWLSDFRYIIAIVLITIGLLMFVVELYGVYRFSFVLNRMHAAAIGDTLGLSCCLIGLMVITGFTFTTVKFLMAIIFMWISSPVASHLIARFEVEANEKVLDYCSEMEIKNEEESK